VLVPICRGYVALYGASGRPNPVMCDWKACRGKNEGTPAYNLLGFHLHLGQGPLRGVHQQ
jgi:hypothetical protein